MKFTIAIPTHEMENRTFFFKRCLDSLWGQTFQDFEIVVTDNSDDNMIKDICGHYGGWIRYYKNKRKGMPQNTNEAIKKSEGELIKILYMDDYLLHDKVLEEIADKFEKGWLICGADNNSSPRWTGDIHTGNNKLGSPSALTIENKKPLFFDEKLTWLLDADLYRRYYEKYGEPTIMHGKHIGIGIGSHQLTHLISDERKLSEGDYLMKKYNG